MHYNEVVFLDIKKTLLFGGLVGLKGGEWFQNTPYFLKEMRF
ncbi:hypothetical protein [Helicobacter pylori]|nr:hypothetical protein [Helicobacter pylori]